MQKGNKIFNDVNGKTSDRQMNSKWVKRFLNCHQDIVKSIQEGNKQVRICFQFFPSTGRCNGLAVSGRNIIKLSFLGGIYRNHVTYAKANFITAFCNDSIFKRSATNRASAKF